MDATATPDQTDVLPSLQGAVQLKMGGCLLRLQQYELLLKALIPHVEVAGPPAQLESLRNERVASVQKQTLGGLVGMLTGSYLSSGSSTDTDEAEADDTPGDGAWVKLRHCLVQDAERYEVTKTELKELVDLRNELVHHLLQRFDINQAEGCHAALAYLDRSRSTIDAHYATLRRWIRQMDEARAVMASFIRSQNFENLRFDDISPDGQVQWPADGIVHSLREAEAALSQSGWTALEAAIAWLKRQAPEQTPKRYGYRSWRHVLHESRQFEIRKRPTSAEGAASGTVVWYRSRTGKQS